MLNNARIVVLFLAVAGSLSAVTDPNFSLHNKSGKHIFVQVNNNISTMGAIKGFFKSEAKGVVNNGFYDLTLNLDKPTELIIFDNMQVVIAKVKFPLQKTIYVNWNGVKVYPQRGPLAGWTGKTDQGYSLANNVVEGQIVPLPLK